MKIIITTASYNYLKASLMRCHNYDDISNFLLSLGYFSYFEIKNKRKTSLLKLCEELEFYRELRMVHPQFPDTVNIFVMHNEFFYEEEGISKLDYWSLFRNVVSNFTILLDKETKFADCINLVTTKIIKNNFSSNDFMSLKMQDT